MNKKVIGVLLVITPLMLWLAGRVLITLFSPQPEGLGVQQGRLAACPDSPNCVSSYESDEVHGMEAIPFVGNAAATQARLLTVIQNQPRTRIIRNEPGYLHVEFRSLIWGFVDDVEFYIADEAGLLHFRSASRLGYGDDDVNRNRMIQIEQLLGVNSENER